MLCTADYKDVKALKSCLTEFVHIYSAAFLCLSNTRYMKKIIGLFIGLAAAGWLAMPAQAQLRFGVKGGVNFASVRLNKAVADAENVTGFHIGPTMEFLVPLVGIGLDASVLYSQKGLEQDYIEVPVNLKWKAGFALLKGYIAAGPYIEFHLGGQDIKEQWTSKSFGAGLNFGAGVEVFTHLNIGFNYGLGLTNNFGKPSIADVRGKSSTPAITAAYLF